MNILYFIDEINSESGINFDIKNSAKILKKYHDIDVFFVDFSEKNIFSSSYILKLGDINRFLQFFYIKKFVLGNNINTVHIRGVGMGSMNHLVSQITSIILSLKIVLNTFSQINSYAINNKMFFENPDVKKIYDNKKNDYNRTVKLKKFIVPILKKIYFYTLAKIFLNRVDLFIFFS